MFSPPHRGKLFVVDFKGSSLTVEAMPATEPGFSLRRVFAFLRTLGRAEMGDDHYPSVVVVNGRGQRFRLFGASNWEEAIAKRDRLRRELAEMDEEVWCDHYVVPGAFLRGEWPPPG